MVGVPNRSKACHNCRQRRIKCDEELPACKNCAKSKRVCTGYQRKHAFILSKDMVPQAASSASPPFLGHDLDSGAVMVSRWRIDPLPVAIPILSSREISPTQPSRSSATADTGASKMLLLDMPARNVFCHGLLSMFAGDGISADSSMKLTFGERNEWITHAIQLPSLCPALEHAILSVCTARLGRHTNRPELIRQSLVMYTKSLSELRRHMLSTPPAQRDEQSLASCLALLVYEVTECPSGTLDGYVAHYQGTMELLRMRGAESHTAGLAHSVFRLLRMHAVLQGIAECKQTFLAQPEWRDIPWSASPAGKAPFEELIDILLQVPGLFAQRQALESISSPMDLVEHTLRSMEAGHKLESILIEWFSRFQAAVPGALYHAELSKMESAVDNPQMGKLFPVAFRFPAFTVGQNMIYYWMALMSIHAHLCITQAMLVGVKPAMLQDKEAPPCTCTDTRPGLTQGPATCPQHWNRDMLPRLDDRKERARATCVNICQSVEWFLQDSMKGFGPATVLPALALVKGFWKHAVGDWSREVAWVDDVIQQISADGGGIGIASTLL